MASSFLRKLFRKRRKHPIKRDEFGKSARRRAFELFNQGMRPSTVARLLGTPPKTSFRYFQDWKRLPRKLEDRYQLWKAIFKHSPELSAAVMKDLAELLGLPVDDVRGRLEKPWGTKQLLMGRWPNYKRQEEQTKAEVRLEAALRLTQFLELSEMTPEKIRAWSLEIWEKVQELKSRMQSP